MKLLIRDDSVEIDGYVNAIERESKPLMSRLGTFVEKIKKGAFAKALEENDNVRVFLNHKRDIGGQADGNLELEEDAIGLKAHTVITDPEVVRDAKNGDLVGWSFGFRDKDVTLGTNDDGLLTRAVNALELIEVSILNREASPAYEGTLIEVRDEQTHFYSGLFEDEIEVRQEPKQPKEVEKINYSKYEEILKEIKED